MMDTMIQQVVTAPKEITFQTVDILKPGSDQVLVKVMGFQTNGTASEYFLVNATKY